MKILTIAETREIIADHMWEAYQEMGTDIHLVSSQILFLASQDDPSICGPDALESIEIEISNAGGVLAHQAKFQFTMKVGK